MIPKEKNVQGSVRPQTPPPNERKDQVVHIAVPNNALALCASQEVLNVY